MSKPTDRDLKAAWNDGYSAALANARDHLGITDEDLGDLWDELVKLEEGEVK